MNTPTNSLEDYVKANGLDAGMLLDDLQERCLVSDNAVHLADVCREDSNRVVARLKSLN